LHNTGTTVQSLVDGALPANDLNSLFRDARRGDNIAVRALVARIRPKLFGIAFSVVHNTAAADDIAQEAMVRILTSSALFAGLGSLEGWMMRIAQNAAKNHRRNQQRRQQLINQTPPEVLQERGALQKGSPSVADQMQDEQLKAQLHRAIAELPERQREVVSLRAIAGLEFSLIAQTLRITEANARMAFSNAKKQLHRSLEPS
jgi:RNA polymerase sigma-70 factor, ECF subfamily